MLLAASSTNEDIQLVTFFLDGEEYGVDVMRVREITGMTEITRTANTPHYLKGIINLRGAIVPIVSLRSRLGVPEPLDDSASCIAVTDFHGELTGFIIDEISDVIRIKSAEIQQTPESASQPWIEGVFFQPPGHTMVILLNLEPFCQA
jgi:purine-binding chemotaxis protein CheW